MPRPRILVVENDEDLRRLYTLALSAAGFDVTEAADGVAALHALDRDPPNVVVLDLILPGVDGFAVRRELESRSHTRRIPVVVVTAIPAEDLQHLAVNCLLTKPVMPAAVVLAVQRCLTA